MNTIKAAALAATAALALVACPNKGPTETMNSQKLTPGEFEAQAKSLRESAIQQVQQSQQKSRQ
jgi:predicted small lipoprotein YifL